MKISRNRLKKCCTPTQSGSPGFAAATADTTVPGLRAMKSCIEVMFRRPLAAATATIRTTNPIGSNHSRLNHLLRPVRTRGAMPRATGTEPAHVVGSTTSSPTVSCERKLATTSGVTPASGALLRSVIRARYVPGAQALPAGSDNGRRLG